MDIETVRPNTLYVSWQTHKALDYLAKARETTRDAIAEEILCEWIKANHPEIVAHLKKRYDEDKQFIKIIQSQIDVPIP